MTERIYIRNATGTLEPLTEQRFDTEAMLQKLIGRHPELLAGDQMRPDDPLRWILIKREMPIEGWAVDHLLIDQHGRPTLVEVKRGASRQIRRSVVGQMLDYAATAANVWSGGKIRQAFEDDARSRCVDPDDEIGELLSLDNQDDTEDLVNEFWERAVTNLDANRLRLLFVADEIPAELERVVKFLNEHTRDNLEVLAVEVKQYPGQFGQALVSRVIGQVDPAHAIHTDTNKRVLDRREFLNQYPDDVSDALGSLFDAIARFGNVFGWRRGNVAIRRRCSTMQKGRVYLARFWLPTASDSRHFEFTMDNKPDYPPELQKFLEQWIDLFSKDDFATEVRTPQITGWRVKPDDFVKHTDLLTTRLSDVLAELSGM